MAKIIAVTNQKGGVGKTTTAVNLAASLGLSGKKILVCDIDPQGNATSGLGVNKKNLKLSTYDVMVSGETADDAIIKTPYKNVDLMPADANLAGAEILLVSMDKREHNLYNALVCVKSKYDYIFIDCPPSLGIITLNGLIACDTVLIPIQCEFYALEGLSQLMNTLRQIKKVYNSPIEVEGVLLTMYDARLNLTLQVAGEVKNFFKNKVFKTTIPRNVRLSEAPSHGMPVIYYDKYSRGSESYQNLALEIISNN